MIGVLPVPAVAPHLPGTLREPGLTSGPVQVTSSSLRSRVPELRDGGSRGSLQRGVEVAARDEGAKVGVVGEHLVGHELVEQQDQVGHLVLGLLAGLVGQGREVHEHDGSAHSTEYELPVLKSTECGGEQDSSDPLFTISNRSSILTNILVGYCSTLRKLILL